MPCNYNGILIIAETTKSLKGRLSNLRDEIQKQGFDIYSDEEEALHLLKLGNYEPLVGLSAIFMIFE